ncbi:MAG: glycerol-3-phosphate dehydrogenase/oxidase [Bryobacteraceae bacterium]|nr:glycerol-3-phosphate dehydrogenase/oxidase [Bryobacterales bacterium]NUN01969.1 glycerol-3-phosphate dehydrogenase/oxidase [Bryobacteraceae bacterium]
MSRFSELHFSTFDVVVIGGGIVGAGIARDATLRGLKVALLEKNDFGSGTTAGSTRLVHGGLRYLEMLDFRLVRMDLREREILLRIAPHLVRPLRFVLPFYEKRLAFRIKLRAGMMLYDALSFDRSLPGHRYTTKAETLRDEPSLSARGLQGAVTYSDAQVASPERLCLENILDARENGCIALNYAEVTGALRERGRVCGVRARDVLTGETMEVSGRVVINASGPWLDAVTQSLQPAGRRRIRMTKGIHIACPPVSEQAYVLTSPLDGRLFFVIPWLGYSWIGTTDTDFIGDPASARATAEDVAYLVESASAFFPQLRDTRIFWTNAGVRALVMRKGRPSGISRLHRIVDETPNGSPGLISVLGGKITGYRAIAEEATDAACALLSRHRKSVTAALSLPGARGDAPSGALPHLQTIYGSRTAEVTALADADQRLAQPLDAAYPGIAAQVVHAVRSEQAVRVGDFLLRRSYLGFSEDQGMRALAAVADTMAAELRWSAARKSAEIEEYTQWTTQTQQFRNTAPAYRS